MAVAKHKGIREFQLETELLRKGTEASHLSRAIADIEVNSVKCFEANNPGQSTDISRERQLLEATVVRPQLPDKEARRRICVSRVQYVEAARFA
jgi:hypothetical protein